MTDHLIDARDVTHMFGPVKALDRLTLRIEPGTVYGLVGPNGSGKTTFVRILCGLQRPTMGTVRVMGHDVVAHPEEVRNVVGYMSQRFSLYFDLTAQENLQFFAKAHGLFGATARRRIDELVEVFKLGPYLRRPAFALSGGWKQRLALATTLIHSPTLAFLDEPTAGVDPVARRELWDLLFELASGGMNIFLTTQYIDEVERCGEVGYLYLSKLVISGTPDRMKSFAREVAGDARYVAATSRSAVTMVGWLRAREYCDQATVLGHSVHALIKTAVSNRQLQDACRAAGFPDAVVHDIEPTLEDVFIALTKWSQRPEPQRQAAAGR